MLPYISHPVLHGLLNQVEAFPTGVKLMFVRAFEMQQVTDDLNKSHYSQMRLKYTDGNTKGTEEHNKTFTSIIVMIATLSLLNISLIFSEMFI